MYVCVLGWGGSSYLYLEMTTYIAEMDVVYRVGNKRQTHDTGWISQLASDPHSFQPHIHALSSTTMPKSEHTHHGLYVLPSRQ